MAPLPKPSRQRVRRNATPPPVDLPAVNAGPTPDLPEGDWSQRTRDWWEAARTSPAAHLWTSSDWEFAVMTAALVEGFWRDPRASSAAEIRQRELRLALTLEGRRRLYLPDAPGSPESDTTARRPASSRRPRPRLQVVDPAV